MSSILIGNVKIDTTYLMPAQVNKIKAMSSGAKAAALAAEFTKQNRQNATNAANRADNLAAGTPQAGDTGWGKNLGEKSLQELQDMLKVEKYPTRAEKLRAAIAQKQPAQEAPSGQPPQQDNSGGQQQQPPEPQQQTQPVITPIDKVVDVVDPVNKNGRVDVAAGTESVQELAADSAKKNLNLNNPNQTDILGNSRTIVLNDDGTVSITDKAGQLQTLTQEAFRGALGQIQSQGQLDLSKAPQIQNADQARQQARDANYSYFTRDLERQKQQEINDKKQELTERGIPIDARSGSLWSDSLAEIDRKYKTADDQARQQAIMTGDQSAVSNTNISSVAHNSAVSDMTAMWESPYKQATTLQGFLGTTAPSFQAFQGSQYDNQANNYINLAQLDVQQIMQRLGLSQAAAIAAKEDATNRLAIEAQKNKGGGGAAADPGFSIAGEAP